MKTDPISNTMTLFCMVILLTSPNFVKAEGLEDNTASEFRPVEPNRIPEILTIISEKVRSNYERINTWQGKTDVTINVIYGGAAAERIFTTHTDGAGEIPKAVIKHTESIIQFAVDAEKDFLYVKYDPQKPQQYMDLETGRDLGAKGIANRRRAIVTPEYELHCMGDTMRDGIVMSRKAVKQSRQTGSTCASTLHPVFDPRSHLINGHPIWETFSRIIQYINEHNEYAIDGYTIKIEERNNGGFTEYRVQIPRKLSPEQGKLSPENYLFITRTFSSAKGFTVILEEVTHPDGRFLQRWTWDYDLVDDVYVPTKTSQQNFMGGDGKLSYDRKSAFKNLQINHPIPPETFTYKNLGLEDGDKFVDKILGKEFTYQDQTLIEVEKKDN